MSAVAVERNLKAGSGEDFDDATMRSEGRSIDHSLSGKFDQISLGSLAKDK